MTQATCRYLYLSAALAALTVAACSAHSTTPSAPRNQPASRSAAGGAAFLSFPAPNATATNTTLKLGTSIGINTFPDGDTQSGGQGSPVDNINCATTMPTAYHIHVHVSIFDPQGNQIMVPWAIGIKPPWGFNAAHTAVLTGTCYYHLHTHDRSGVIHDESRTANNWTLGNFFDIWGMPLSTTNVAGYVGHVYVYSYVAGSGVPGSWSGTTDPRTIPLQEHLEVTLSVGRKFLPVPHYGWAY